MSKPQASASNAECVKVMIRARPMNSSETGKGCESIITVDKNNNEIILRKPRVGDSKEPPKSFFFDAVFGTETSQKLVYEESAFGLVESVLEGYNGTIFAYGQTGCGKTHTMVGLSDEANQGIIPNAFGHIFGSISSFDGGKRFLLRCSYLEIYNEGIHDLLEYDPDKKLELKEDPQKGIYVKGLTTVIVRSAADTRRTMDNGTANRHTAETMMNKTSSRSHTIFTIYIEMAEKRSDGSELVKAGKLNLVDLAGSERQSKTKAEGDRLKEATKINLSLSALGNVISALVDGKSSHIPYRDSKLTRLLQDSLGGNTKTVMIACISPASYNYDETLSTLRYASRAKQIQNKPRINEDPKDALLRQYENEIKNLRELLSNLSKGSGVAEKLKAMEAMQKSLAGENAVKLVEELKATPEKPKKKVEELEVEKEMLNKDKERAELELMAREQEFLSEKEQKARLEDMIYEMEQKMLTGGQEFEERTKEQAKKYNEMKQQLKKQRMKEKKLREEHQKKEQEMLQVEKQYKNIQDELKDKTNLIKELSVKTEAALVEIKDIQQEHQAEKENLLESIRDQNHDLDFYKKVVEILMSDEEMRQIKERAEWDSEAGTWKVPQFVVQSKQVMLPALSGKPQEEEKKGRSQEGDVVISVTGSCRSTFHKAQNSVKSVGEKPSKKAEHTLSSEQGEKHLFNWNVLSKGNKYTNPEKKLKSPSDSPGQAAIAALRKNAHLETLSYNPAEQLSPVDEEDIKRRLATLDPNDTHPKVPKKSKVLAKIDDSLLSNLAKTPNITMDPVKSPTGVSKGHWNAPTLGAVGKLKPIFQKLPSLKNDG